MADIFTSAQKPGPPVLSHFSSHRSTRGRTNEATTNARSVAASCVDETPIALLDPVIKHPLPPQGLIEPLVDLADLDFVGCGKSTTLHPNPPSDDHVGPQNVTRPVKSPGNMRGANVKRWAAKTCTTSEWNGLRRDPELWFADGNCFVYLYVSHRRHLYPLPLISCNQLRPWTIAARTLLLRSLFNAPEETLRWPLQPLFLTNDIVDRTSLGT